MEMVEVDKPTLRYILRAIDTAQAEIEAGVADGSIDSAVLVELDSAARIIQELLSRKA